MKSLVRRVKRWWRSRGHGVHSPFAFRFITMVLRGRAVYYASAELAAMPDPRWHTLLFRMVCEFEPAEVHAPALTASERRALTLADSRVKIVDEHNRLDRPNEANEANKAGPNKANEANKAEPNKANEANRANEPNKAEPNKANKPNEPNKPNNADNLSPAEVRVVTMPSPKGDVTLVRDITRTPDLWQALLAGMTCGMTFTDGRIGIAVTRPDLPRQDFEII